LVTAVAPRAVDAARRFNGGSGLIPDSARVDLTPEGCEADFDERLGSGCD
jgi:hypothetical protein